ncbi:hypothetical protein ACT3TH_06445 [Psychrobacter sp. AOP22-C1-C5]|uniref:hypothetical protein n=1 Tax=Psychrobacter sp. AOP22-C1-C5 TaxID=3457716 RepID=UPI0040364B27
MSIIDQLERTVTPAVLGESDRKSSVAYVSLLEQFYAILVARLALPQVYSHLIRNDNVITTERAVESPLFEQLWQDPDIQQILIQELSATHHIDALTTSQLLINASPLAYRELKILANGQFLPAFLQPEQTALRQYLPIWSVPVIDGPQNHSNESNLNPNLDSKTVADITTALMSETPLAAIHKPDTDTGISATSIASDVANANYLKNADENRTATDFTASTDAIHANPSAHHWSDNGSMKREKIRTRNQRNDLLVRVFLLIIALTAIAFAAWAMLIRPNNAPPVVPVVAEPVVPPSSTAPPAQVMTPVELIVGVDNNGSLYNCSATVGDEALQSTLQQALNASFGEQASICQFTVRAGVATDIAAMPAPVLPNIFTMLRSTPFARLHLQNDRLTLEAPDSILLQRLVTDIRALAPTMVIDSTAPLPLPNNSNGDPINGMTSMNGANSQFENGGVVSNNQYNNYNGSGSGEYQASDDNTGDRVLPAPNSPAPNNGSFNNNTSTLPANVPNNSPSNSVPTNNAPTRPSGPISLSEVDDMASSVIVVEPAQVR